MRPDAVLLDPPQRNWQCPSCDLQHVTFEARPHTPMHPCAKMNGLLAPFVEVTTRSGELDRKAARLVRVDREDYVGDEVVRTDGLGRPAMAVRTERADGSNDSHVFADCARFDLSRDFPHLAQRIREDPEAARRVRARLGLEAK